MTATRLNDYIAASADPDAAAIRLDGLREDRALRQAIDGLPDETLRQLVHLLSFSRFLYHFISRHPEVLALLGEEPLAGLVKADVDAGMGLDTLRLFKYRELLKITWLDITQCCAYEKILGCLSGLAEYTVNKVLGFSIDPKHRDFIEREFCVFGLGKLGAEELNYSSDIDLMFVSANTGQSRYEIYDLQEIAQNTIRRFNHSLEEKGKDGFLYRVDLKLRPWGASGPLFMTIDETENYYEASSDAWERFAWLRGRPVAGAQGLGEDLKQRLHPFIYRRSLSTEDLQKFVDIKNEMTRIRNRRGHWNVKVGEGGIRDLEFFVQMLQIVNASNYEALQTTNTLKALNGLRQAGLITDREAGEITHSYLFLRRLENHLQMRDEQQVHELPDDEDQRLIIARSLRTPGHSDDEILDNFENQLFTSRTIARSYFERILPEGRTDS
jgi:glutamate-ammonia-ligase adenylyltransferase